MSGRSLLSLALTEQQINRARQSHSVPRDPILEAAGRVVTTRGIASATIHDLSNEVGVTEGAGVVTEYRKAGREILETGSQRGSIPSNVDLSVAATNLFDMMPSTATLWTLDNYNTPLARRCGRQAREASPQRPISPLLLYSIMASGWSLRNAVTAPSPHHISLVYGHATSGQD